MLSKSYKASQMKIKVGTKFKAIEGLSKGKEFTVISVDSNNVIYRSEDTGNVYTEPRKHFEKYLQRVNKHWSETTKNYKHKKQNMF